MKKILEMLKSNDLEMAKLGGILLVQEYSIEEIKKLMNEFGNSGTNMSNVKTISRGYVSIHDSVYIVKDKWMLYVGHGISYFHTSLKGSIEVKRIYL